eukprot:TRINITY_DN781901_c0_g1_i1.p1 TRINITY_DN781901_c0_g1~~TRINITY_DN781901_c0_g1_i1.p1  ORF type:complete len:206 (-),score=28.76 TRINITY_DN781901_c0_g1_i1:177-794(-)
MSQDIPINNDTESFLFPDAIPSQLICPICQGVVKHAIEAPCCGTLYCESELLDWMVAHEDCPYCKTELNPEDIKPPARIIKNMLSELKRKCEFEELGCKWTGESSNLQRHLQEECNFVPAVVLRNIINKQKDQMERLRDKNDHLKSYCQKQSTKIENIKLELELSQDTVALLKQELIRQNDGEEDSECECQDKIIHLNNFLQKEL